MSRALQLVGFADPVVVSDLLRWEKDRHLEFLKRVKNKIWKNKTMKENRSFTQKKQKKKRNVFF